MTRSLDTSHKPSSLIDSMEDFIASSRYLALAELKKGKSEEKHSGDLSHLIRTTRAIIATNQEIWERCKGSLCESPTEDGKGLQFQRVALTSVRVKNVVNHPSRLRFFGVAEVHGKDFGDIPTVPNNLTDLVAYNGDTSLAVLDYELYLGRCMVLHQLLLAPFLVELKEHLEEVQVFLGEVEAWLMEPIACVDFLALAFNKTLVIPEAENFTERARKVVLKTCDTTGQYKQTFHIVKEADRRKLEKFLDYIV